MDKGPKDDREATEGTALLNHPGSYQAMDDGIQTALPIAGGPSSVEDVQIQPVPLPVKIMSLLCIPLCPCGFYTVDTKTATASLHMGVLTSLEKEPGLHWTWP